MCKIIFIYLYFIFYLKIMFYFISASMENGEGIELET